MTKRVLVGGGEAGGEHLYTEVIHHRVDA
eukprot:COSAG01_NODE_42477_length_439_cov_3.941176_2_plen_28_part_01